MDRKVWLQYLTPDEAVARRNRCSALLIPVSPVEWHGPHLPLGTDAIAAAHFAERAAQILGATVYPTLFVGTERERPPAMLRSIGLPERAHIEGMDFPANNYKSFYFREEVLALVLRDVIGMAKANGYRVVHIVNCHGAVNQLAVIARLCAESSDRIPKFLLPVIRAQLAAGGEIRRSAAVVASWARYAEGVDDEGEPIEVVDRLAARLTRAARRQRADPDAFIANRDVFGDLVNEKPFVAAYRSALASLHQRGARATLESLV